MTSERSFAVFAALLLFCSSTAKAAKNAWVITNGTSNSPVLQTAPKPGAQTVTNLQAGDPITISNYPTNGYYKARSASGQIGWIAVTSIGSSPPAQMAQPTTAPAPSVVSTPVSTSPVSSSPVSSSPVSSSPVSSSPVAAVTQTPSAIETPPPTADLELDIPPPPPDVPLTSAPTQAPVAQALVAPAPATTPARPRAPVSTPAPTPPPVAYVAPVAPKVVVAPITPAAPPPVSYPYVDVQPTTAAAPLVVQQPETPAPEPAPTPTGLPFELKAFGGVQSLQTVIAFTQIGATLFSSVTYLGMQFGFPVSDKIFLLIRLEHLFNSISEDSYDFSMSATPLMAGLSYSFLPLDFPVRLRGSLLLGIDLGTTLSATATDDPSPNTTEVQTQTFTEMAKVDFEIPFTQGFALFAEGGYRFLSSASVGPSSLSPNGSSIFEQGGSTVPIQMSFTGFFGGAGLAFYL